MTKMTRDLQLASTPHLKDGHLRAALMQRVPHMSPEIAKESVLAILDALDEGLRETGRVTLPGFGSFEIIEHRINTKGLKNQDGKPPAAPRARLKFSPYRGMVSRINSAQSADQAPFAQDGADGASDLFNRK